MEGPVSESQSDIEDSAGVLWVLEVQTRYLRKLGERPKEEL